MPRSVSCRPLIRKIAASQQIEFCFGDAIGAEDAAALAVDQQIFIEVAGDLRARLNGQMLKHYVPRRRTLYLLATGDRRAILSWGTFALAGKLFWRLKGWIDRRFVRHHAIAAERERRMECRKQICSP